METIRIIATFTAIAPANRERFKATVFELTELVASEEGTPATASCIESTKANEPSR